ncbi:MAG: PHP domain-containing protein [Clostridia bacterium]|nr:PHP domain-containing protein [Clostridia bacterium]
MFKTELHAHSGSVSNCADVPEDKIVERYIAEGYTTIVLTNHLSRFTYKNKNFDHSADPWDKKIDFYMNGYHLMKDAAAGRINVLLGVELRSNRDENDYLIHGVSEEFLRSMPNIMDDKLEFVIDAVHEAGGLFYQAHPFRNAMRITKPELLDGIEVYNGHIGQQSRNDIAYMWAEKFGLRKISGSDFHHDNHVVGAGIETDVPITSEAQLVEILREQNYTLIRSGAVPY